MEEALLNVESKETRLAHLKNGDLFNLEVERKKERQLTGNIYRGRVTNILRNIQSAFIDINEGENGFIHIRHGLLPPPKPISQRLKPRCPSADRSISPAGRSADGT